MGLNKTVLRSRFSVAATKSDEEPAGNDDSRDYKIGELRAYKIHERRDYKVGERRDYKVG